MSIKKFRLNRKNSSGSYDTIHYETSSNIVLRPDGTTVEESLISSNLPKGLIVMWSGASSAIPSGWLLCNGENNTPDLRNRFIVGAGSSYSVGNTGGSDSVTLTTTQMPSHSHGHNLSTVSAGSHTHTFSGTTNNGGESSNTISGYRDDNDLAGYSGEVHSCRAYSSAEWTINIGGKHTHSYSGNTGSAGAHTHSLSGSISNTGSGQSHENRPPYYALCFIMKE